MPGRLLPSFVRPALSTSTSSTSSRTSSSSSLHEVASNNSSHSVLPLALPRKHHDRARSPERRLSFAVDHLIHPHRDQNKEKRRSLGRSKDRGTKEQLNAPPSAKVDVIVESPPLVCYGTPANSTGALFSGRLRIQIAESNGPITLDVFDMRLNRKITTKKPVSRDCPSCNSQTEELTSWNFLTEPLHLTSGTHDFPFSYLFPGNTPASCRASLGQIEYFLSGNAHSAAGENFNFTMPLQVKRALIPGNDKSSIRVFPPTNLTGRIVLPSVVHPIGTFPVQMTLSGVVEKGEDTQTRWRLRKMMWRIEEQQKIVSSACAKHSHKIGGEGKGVLHQETRVIGHNEEKNGWKTDFDTAGGEISMQFEANINPTCNPVCDLESSGGLEAKHTLVIELIVAEEFCSNRNTRLMTPTGAARVLRMQFGLNVTERTGLGISWDEEMPPVYEDVPASPPAYPKPDGQSTMEDYEGSPLSLPEYEDLDHMTDSFQLDSCERQRTRLTNDDLTVAPIGAESRPPSVHFDS